MRIDRIQLRRRRPTMGREVRAEWRGEEGGRRGECGLVRASRGWGGREGGKRRGDGACIALVPLQVLLLLIRPADLRESVSLLTGRRALCAALHLHGHESRRRGDGCGGGGRGRGGRSGRRGEVRLRHVHVLQSRRSRLLLLRHQSLHLREKRKQEVKKKQTWQNKKRTEATKNASE